MFTLKEFPPELAPASSLASQSCTPTARRVAEAHLDRRGCGEISIRPSHESAESRINALMAEEVDRVLRQPGSATKVAKYVDRLAETIGALCAEFGVAIQRREQERSRRDGSEGVQPHDIAFGAPARPLPAAAPTDQDKREARLEEEETRSQIVRSVKERGSEVRSGILALLADPEARKSWICAYIDGSVKQVRELLKGARASGEHNAAEWAMIEPLLPKLAEGLQARNNAVADLVILAERKGGIDRVSDGEVSRVLRRRRGADLVTPRENGSSADANRQIADAFKRAFVALEAEAATQADREVITTIREEFLKRVPKLTASMPMDPLPGAAGALIRQLAVQSLQRAE